jgi:putative membrane protein
MREHQHAGPDLTLILAMTLSVVGLAGYGWAVYRSRARGWLWRRTVCWVAGMVVILGALTGPLGTLSDRSFPAHMISHLLVGMLGPLLLVLGAPITLVLRALPVAGARRLSRILATAPVRFLTHPVFAAGLNVGGLWLLYGTGLFGAMHYPVVHAIVHAHVITAGYLFTVSVISVDPLPHRRPYLYRAVVLVAALAAHDILAKHLYIHTPVGIATPDSERGAMIMYYGGDAVDVVIMVVLCARWYRWARPRVLPRLNGRHRVPAPLRTSRTLRRSWSDTPL